MSAFARVITIGLGLSAFACGGTGADPELQACPKLATTFFAKPTSQTIAEFTSYDLEMQYTIYLCGNQYMHPPTLHLSVPFASQGTKAASFLKQKLELGASDLTTRDIVRVFVEMQRQGTYYVKGDASLKALLRNKVQEMSDEYWRGYTESMLSKLEAP